MFEKMSREDIDKKLILTCNPIPIRHWLYQKFLISKFKDDELKKRVYFRILDNDEREQI